MKAKKDTPKYGWTPDRLDKRDKVLTFKVVNLHDLPVKVDLRDKCSEVENQATLGSCTANAAVGALEFLELSAGLVDDKFEHFSRLFVYYNTRELENNIGVDSGASLRNTIKALVNCGACNETIWPYDIDKFTLKPETLCYEDGAPHKITEYKRLTDFSDLLACLANGYPFMFGFKVYPFFESKEMANSGILQLPNPHEKFRGGHAVCAVGYDMDKEYLIVRNSWGTKWGQDGYFLMPFDYLRKDNLASDFWTIKK